MVALSDINVDELHGMKRKQLQALCKKTGVKANGKSEELIERLMEHIQRGGSDSTSDDSNDDQQHYESAAEEDKSSPPPNEGAQNATPGKLFKVVPLLNTEPVVMDAPEAMSVVEPSQFSAQVKEFTAKLEARAAARFADQGVENIEKINPAFGLVTKTPKSQKLAKTILFDKAHDKLFSSGDSILSHWSAKKTAGPATPNGKRNNDSSVHESNKRPRVEVLFASPSVQPQSARQSRKSTRTRSMTAKAQRTAAPGAVLDGSKTAAVDNRVQTASDLKALSSTKLFADAPVADTSSVASEVAEFAPLAEMETTSVLAAASPAKAPLNPPTLQPDAATPNPPQLSPPQLNLL
ncbi:hypothetical protein EV174_004212 [Coemansia sp. RSA 2320]|nr:hypothetical protein EV174_004212 [Coemansia sp. RSA 2320]